MPLATKIGMGIIGLAWLTTIATHADAVVKAGETGRRFFSGVLATAMGQTKAASVS